ncbi:hypothetical protein [Microbacterium invictum]|uniref:Alpha/beta hydrolase n=1 Tax=Microbacterium invictum TaxID=515415 RepID=A0AA40SRT5_9MICO|nr:hypothetical protein [Microbacterium invictum]MBB4141276.1 hypothetical protein [Microbacterium invictum]
MPKHELMVDVSEAVASDQQLSVAVTIQIPDVIGHDPVVCFAFPGGGYSRRYFSFDMPGHGGGGQAGHHTSKGWVFVAVDHLGTGGGTRVEDMSTVTWQQLVDANDAAVAYVLDRLGSGSLVPGLRAIQAPRTLGLAQSMGGALLILHQGQKHRFDAVAVLGWSASHSVSWLPPGTPRAAARYFPRGSDVGAMTRELHTTAMPEMARDADGLPATASGFHYDDVPRDIVIADLTEYPTRRGELPEWATDVVPPSSMTMMSPGAVAPEAAMIRVPVFVGVGERDVTPDPRSEPRAYLQSCDVTVHICPRMGHMHNFAGTRKSFWQRIHNWAEAVLARPADDDEQICAEPNGAGEKARSIR